MTVVPSSLSGLALRVLQKAAEAATLEPVVQRQNYYASSDQAIIEVRAAAVNPSDVKAALGMMPQACWPRTPGRDFAGTVVEGPKEWLGKHVWGTGGDIGITRDGSHARYLVLPVQALTLKPEGMPMAAAGAVGVPFVTAYEGLRRVGFGFAAAQSLTVTIFGVNGMVGQAAAQLATRAGARVLGVARGGRYDGHVSGPITLFDGDRPDLATALIEAGTSSIAYNTVGSPYFSSALEALAVGGTQILISTVERQVTFDIIGFYRRNLHLLGVDTLKLSAVDCAPIMQALLPGFEDGSLRAFAQPRVLPLEAAGEAFRRLLAGSPVRIVLAP